jgi:hypothetical protein
MKETANLIRRVRIEPWILSALAVLGTASP